MIDKTRIENAVKEILLAVGEDPDRPGLRETPQRVANMYEEIFAGIHADPRDTLKVFNESFQDQMVVVKDIPFYSMCEHHILPFYGVAHLAYMPAPGRLLGLSKLARLVDIIAKKPQLQEKMGNEIADILFGEAGSPGVAVVMEAEHLCMNMRGIKKPGSKTVTTAFRGVLQTDLHLRSEALQLLRS